MSFTKDIATWVRQILSRAHSTPPQEPEMPDPESKTPEEWGLGPVVPVLKYGDRGKDVEEYQGWLLELGYDLPKFGADGDLGDETLNATRQYQDEHGLTATEDSLKLRGVGSRTYESIQTAPRTPQTPSAPVVPMVTILPEGARIVDITDQHDDRTKHGKRAWKDVKGITLHQTATNLGTNPQRYGNVSAHIGVCTDGQIVLINRLTDIVWHGNSFNSHDVGIEIDGHFAGVEGDLSTYWRPASQPNRMPMSLGEVQANAALAAIAWILKTVEDHGGKVEYIHAHRQSSKQRTSDPGSRVWQMVGLEAKRQWGLKDGGPDFSAGGYPIPKEWDPEYTHPYRSW